MSTKCVKLQLCDKKATKFCALVSVTLLILFLRMKMFGGA